MRAMGCFRPLGKNACFACRAQSGDAKIDIADLGCSSMDLGEGLHLRKLRLSDSHFAMCTLFSTVGHPYIVFHNVAMKFSYP